MLDVLAAFDPIADPATKWKTDTFFKFYSEYYYPCIHHHHDAEEKIYNPAIEAKIGKTIGGNIKNDHEDLMKQLEQVKAFQPRIAAGDAAALREFKAFFRSMVQFMEEHLAEEEQSYPALLRLSGMTEQEEGAVVGQIIQSLGLDGNKRFLPAIVYAGCMWKGEEQFLQWVSKNVPPPIQMLLNKCWICDFYHNQLQPLEALKQREEFTPEPPQCSLCTVM